MDLSSLGKRHLMGEVDDRSAWFRPRLQATVGSSRAVIRRGGWWDSRERADPEWLQDCGLNEPADAGVRKTVACAATTLPSFQKILERLRSVPKAIRDLPPVVHTARRRLQDPDLGHLLINLEVKCKTFIGHGPDTEADIRVFIAPIRIGFECPALVA